MKRWSVALMLAACNAHAAVPNDFAYGLQLETPPGGSVYVVDLPTPVYVGLTRPDLGDLRVFNARGDEVPYALRQPKLVEGEAPAPQNVPLFPLYGEAAEQPNLALRVQTDAGGAIVDLQSGRTLHDEQAVAYLLDLSAVHARPTALDLQWELPPKTRGFVAHVSLSASDDLAHWSTVVVDATVTDLGYGGNRLERRQVELPAFSGKYLRIEWPQEARAAQITAAQLRFAAPASYPARQWLAVEGKPEMQDPNRYRFFSGGFFPVDCVRVSPHEANTAVRVVLASRPESGEPWRRRGEGLVYNLTLEKEGLASEPFCFAPTTDPHWQLEVAASGGGFGHGRPTLELGWNPHRLVFVARGEGPFIVAYGSTRVGLGSVALDPLLQELESQHLGMGKAAVSGTPFALGGPARLEVKKELPWRRVALWGVLIGGVLGLAWMAWRLTRDMNPPNAG